jgi:hypothetical protein
VGRRSRQREKLGASPGNAGLTAPTGDYSDADDNVLRLRGSLTAKARREYARTLAGASGPGARPAATREDAEQRALELLFERLAVRWVVAGAPIERQRELLARLRVASAQERAWVRGVLREHCAEHFPELEVP